jgi:hypothetical protein
LSSEVIEYIVDPDYRTSRIGNEVVVKAGRPVGGYISKCSDKISMIEFW